VWYLLPSGVINDDDDDYAIVVVRCRKQPTSVLFLVRLHLLLYIVFVFIPLPAIRNPKTLSIQTVYACVSLSVCKSVRLSLSTFLPRCMECRRGLAMRILSVCLPAKRVHHDKTEKKICPDFYTIRRIT